MKEGKLSEGAKKEIAEAIKEYAGGKGTEHSQLKKKLGF